MSKDLAYNRPANRRHLEFGGAVILIGLLAGAAGATTTVRMPTPSLATRAALGSVCALAITAVSGYHLNVPVISLACAAGVLTVTQRAPIWAGIFVWELARPPWCMLAVFLAAALAAHGLRLLSERYLPATRS